MSSAYFDYRDERRAAPVLRALRAAFPWLRFALVPNSLFRWRIHAIAPYDHHWPVLRCRIADIGSQLHR